MLYKELQILILTIKENCQTEIWKETALIELLVSFPSFEVGKLLYPGVLLRYFDPGVGVLH